MHRAPEPPDPAKVRDAVLDVFVFAPIGFLFDARDVVPKLAARGRGQVTLARLFGRYAWQRGQAEAERVLARNQAAPSEPAPPPPPSAAPPPSAPDAKAPTVARTRARSPRTTTAGPTLAIPGYDSLSASQVVPRLEALLPDELEAVRRHEADNRGRRTILNRIAQLQR
jgi:hypothetical protein